MYFYQTAIYTQLKQQQKMKHLFIRFCKSLLKLEHIIYCATNCKVEFLLHKKYYAYCEKVYTEYLLKKKSIHHNIIADNHK